MIRHTKWLAVVAMLLVVSPAFAQPEGGRGPGRGQQGGRFGGGFGGGFGAQTKYSLLGNPAVQEELAIAPEQKEKAQALLGEFREALRGGASQEDFAALRDLPAEERREKMAEFAKKREEATTKAIADFKPVGGPDELKKLTQRLLDAGNSQRGIDSRPSGEKFPAPLDASEFHKAFPNGRPEVPSQLSALQTAELVGLLDFIRTEILDSLSIPTEEIRTADGDFLRVERAAWLKFESLAPEISRMINELTNS